MEQLGEGQPLTFRIVSTREAFKNLVVEITAEPNQHPIISLEHFLKLMTDFLNQFFKRR